MQKENLLMDDLNSKKSVFDDVDSGMAYQNAKDIYVKNPETEKLVLIIMFTDITHTDLQSRLKLDPLQFTLGIFKRKIRNQSRAWKTL